MRLKLIFGNDEKDHELHRRVVECVEFDPGAGTAKRRHHFFQPVRGAVRNGNTEADAGAHRFFALFERSENSITIFRFDLAARDQQIHQLNDGVPALGRLHFRDDLISGKKLSQRHADSSGAGSLSCRFRMTRSIWCQSKCRSEPQENLKIAINRPRGARHQHTRSAPRVLSASKRRISVGSFCISPSIKAATSLRTACRPAKIAALCPAFFLKRRTLVRGSAAMPATVSSCEPSSTKM